MGDVQLQVSLEFRYFSVGMCLYRMIPDFLHLALKEFVKNCIPAQLSVERFWRFALCQMLQSMGSPFRSEISSKFKECFKCYLSKRSERNIRGNCLCPWEILLDRILGSEDDT